MNIPTDNYYKPTTGKKDGLLHYTDDNNSSLNFRLCLPLTLFHSAIDKVHEEFHAGLHFARYHFNHCC